MRLKPITQLPPHYQPDQVIRILDHAVMQELARYNLYLIPPFIFGGILAHHLAKQVTSVSNTDLSSLQHVLLALFAIIGVLIIHEAIHGVMMFWAGHKPRFGVFYTGKLPVALYATTNNGYFQRIPFLMMALAPLVIITITCVCLMWVLPPNTHIYLMIALIINGSGAAGDLYMSWLVWRYGKQDILVLDHAEGITIFTVRDKSAT